jgi:hypothetical protein
MNQPKRCGCCDQHFPNTAKFFYQKVPGRLDTVCRPCRIAINRETERHRKQGRAAMEFVGPKRPPGSPRKPREPRRWATLPVLTVWRGSVPAGYGVAI